MSYTYTYRIKSISIETGTFSVEYMPDDTDLMPVFLNLSIIEKDYTSILDSNTNEPLFQNQQSVPFSYHLDHTIAYYAPIGLWKNQKYMIDNIELLQNKM